jgi:D-arabinose 1-dehydrogenase-like Zn-dependent alcohol dehydrogenase
MSSGWGDMSKMYPQVVGHEIVGKVVRVGKDVKHLKEGDLAGIGAQCDSCMECDSCKSRAFPLSPSLRNTISSD